MSLRENAHLLAAAGIDFRNLSPIEVFLLAGKIINDHELTEACKPQTVALPKGIRAQVLRSWPESERAKLRERITGVIQMERHTR